MHEPCSVDDYSYNVDLIESAKGVRREVSKENMASLLKYVNDHSLQYTIFVHVIKKTGREY